MVQNSRQELWCREDPKQLLVVEIYPRENDHLQYSGADLADAQLLWLARVLPCLGHGSKLKDC